ncbi:uncharacterized protein WCC33_010748 [Rhinophrynus dorsalis]
MYESAGYGTIGELFLALYEMGFEESQVQAALRAGCFKVQDAADWILQGGQQRGALHTLQRGDTGSVAMTAFNRPQEESMVCDLQLPDVVHSPIPDCPLLASSHRARHWREYEEKQNASLAQEVREERRNKMKDRDLALQRIAENRKALQEKGQMTSPQCGPKSQGSAPVTPDNSCALMVRLPSGHSLRLRFPADSTLQCVCDHLDSLESSLQPFCLLQTFPTRRFSEEDLPRSLRDLGLTPNATLCVCPKEIPTAQQDPSPPQKHPVFSHLDLPSANPSAEDLIAEGARLRPILSSPAHSVSPNVQMRGDMATAQRHSWGRGHRLVSMEQDRAGGQQECEPQGAHNVSPSHRSLSSGSHQWPTSGVRLRSMDQSNDFSPGSPSSSPDPPRVMARVAAELRQESAERSPTVCKAVRIVSIPRLRELVLPVVLTLISAPSMQYSRSLSGLTPELAELIIDYMTKERVLRPRTLELFTGCPIQRMTLNCYQYSTNELIRSLRGFPSLRTLSLSSCTLLTDQGLCVVQHLHKLQYLNLGACKKLSDSCLLYLKDLENLLHLVLDQTKVSDDGMCHFLMGTRSSLTHLSVNQTALTERTLSLLSQCTPDLKFLSIKHTQVSDISSLCGLKQLSCLHLDNTQVTERSLLAVTSLPALSTLTLSGAQSLSSDRVLELLSGLPLTHLVLPGRLTLSDDGLSSLSGLRCLSELDLTDHTQITDRGVQHIAGLTRLRVLSLCNTSVSDSGLVHLQGLWLLEDLSLDRTKVTSRGVSQCIPHLPHLQVLGLSDTNVGDNVLKLGIRHCKNLLKVNLSRTRVTNKGLRFLKQVSIVQLSLDGSGVTVQGVSDLMSCCNTIISVRAHNLRLLPSDAVSDDEV